MKILHFICYKWNLHVNPCIVDHRHFIVCDVMHQQVRVWLAFGLLDLIISIVLIIRIQPGLQGIKLIVKASANLRYVLGWYLYQMWHIKFTFNAYQIKLEGEEVVLLHAKRLLNWQPQFESVGGNISDHLQPCYWKPIFSRKSDHPMVLLWRQKEWNYDIFLTLTKWVLCLNPSKELALFSSNLHLKFIDTFTCI